MMMGAEYLSVSLLRQLWQEIGLAVAEAAGSDLQSFLCALNPAWNLVGRVHFNLAENRRDPDYPFAFMATYTTHLGAGGQARHVPLGQALHEYANDHPRLLSLLLPVSRATTSCDWLKTMVDGGVIYHPLRWTVACPQTRPAPPVCNPVSSIPGCPVMVLILLGPSTYARVGRDILRRPAPSIVPLMRP
jgi:non-specific serine/threonine protein kinase